MKYVKGLDSLRAFAVIYVIIEHWGLGFIVWDYPAVAFIRTCFIPDGRFGVNLFFVLSGFLITAILLKSKESAGENRWHVIRNFFVRRSLRIFPIYYLMIILCYFLNYEIVRHYPVYFLTYTSNLLIGYATVPNKLMHTWSLAVEEQFYLIWPWLIIFINSKYLKYVFYAAMIIGVCGKYYELTAFHRGNVLVYSSFDSFGLGALYAWMRLENTRCLKFERQFKFVFLFTLFFAWKFIPWHDLPGFAVFYRFLDSIIAVALIMFVLNNRSAFVKKYLLENRALNFIGKISYGIYLYHFTLGLAYDDFIRNYAKAHPTLPAILSDYYFSYGIKLLILITISWLSYQLIEQPILSLKKKFKYN